MHIKKIIDRGVEMDINVVLFDGFTALDFIGPIEALHRVDGWRPRYFSLRGGAVSNDCGLAVSTEPMSGIEGGVLLVPGGMGTRTLVDDADLISALREQAERASFCLCVCTGSALLAKTGLLDGRTATSNKAAFDWVRSVAPEVKWESCARWTVSDKFYTSSGVSAGIDMALGFIQDEVGREKAEDAARAMEYIWNDDPKNDMFARRKLLIF